MKSLLEYISQKTEELVVSLQPVSGGSISSAYLLETKTNKYFLKVNFEPFALHMFQTEQKGLSLIENANTISVPHVHWVDQFQNHAFLMMDFVESKHPSSDDFKQLGYQLAKLHQIKADRFGLDFDNYIGKLPQSNHQHDHWSTFYWEERIFPQLQTALDNHLLQKREVPSSTHAIAVFDKFLDNVEPALIHGDLWGGNYLIASSGQPYLIDPAVYYGDPMIDIAMSTLFAGFNSNFYNAYHEIIPRPVHYQQKIDLYHLYFLLVHLNLFGSGYYSGVSHILNKYF